MTRANWHYVVMNKVHYLATEYTDDAACGRYMGMPGRRTANYTAVTHDVTCRACIRMMGL